MLAGSRFGVGFGLSYSPGIEATRPAVFPLVKIEAWTKLMVFPFNFIFWEELDRLSSHWKNIQHA